MRMLLACAAIAAALASPAAATPNGAAPSRFFHTYGTWVPGTTYVAGGYQWVSTGAKGRAVTIRANHTWAWHGLNGKWQATGDAEYPLVLLHAIDGHNWKVGAATNPSAHADIVLWDGFTWYYGKRAK